MADEVKMPEGLPKDPTPKPLEGKVAPAKKDPEIVLSGVMPTKKGEAAVLAMAKTLGVKTAYVLAEGKDTVVAHFEKFGSKKVVKG